MNTIRPLQTRENLPRRARCPSSAVLTGDILDCALRILAQNPFGSHIMRSPNGRRRA